MKNKDGVQVSSVCGKKSKDCKLHATKRLGAKSHQHAIGFHPRVSVSGHFTGHGLANRVVCSDDQIEKHKAEEAEEMEKLVQAVNEGAGVQCPSHDSDAGVQCPSHDSDSQL
jgi:hypothetical protein